MICWLLMICSSQTFLYMGGMLSPEKINKYNSSVYCINGAWKTHFSKIMLLLRQVKVVTLYISISAYCHSQLLALISGHIYKTTELHFVSILDSYKPGAFCSALERHPSFRQSLARVSSFENKFK